MDDLIMLAGWPTPGLDGHRYHSYVPEEQEAGYEHGIESPGDGEVAQQNSAANR